MYTYTCGNEKCKQQWTIRNKVEPLVVQCPKCGKKKRTRGRRNEQKELPGKIDGNRGDVLL